MPSPGACWRNAIRRAGAGGGEEFAAAREPVEVFADDRRVEQHLVVIGRQTIVLRHRAAPGQEQCNRRYGQQRSQPMDEPAQRTGHPPGA